MIKNIMRARGFQAGKLFHALNAVICVIISFICLYPFYYIIIYSLSNPQMANRGVFLWPLGFTFINFEKIFQVNNVFNAFFISASRAVAGTAVTLFFSSLLAYLVTKKDLILRRLIYRMVVVTMYLSSGLIPWYMTMKTLGLKNNFLLYILPYAVGAFFVVLFKTYFEQLPDSIEESAVIDGAGTLTVFFRIIIPLSLPIVAAIAVFSAVGQWNMWSDNFFLVSVTRLQTLQLLLYNYLQLNMSEMMANGNANQANNMAITVTPASIRMTISVISIVPIFLVYPLLQKYFIKGIMIEAIKG